MTMPVARAMTRLLIIAISDLPLARRGRELIAALAMRN
eukprot:CAMPEP_0185201762 /NCGR_PEP_ID=MMETSP1140-20130426/49831_1 /TAXON_ID=298111 /ORGANISM="Pavlova sp., Strain CCMP459" /LENGTH=37 /DNA_ID= /DNA_START= /DNA_END= /DNA_ORIENTATION=